MITTRTSAAVGGDPSASATSPVSALGTILSIWAHPDDETYLAGGLMAAAVANGQRVVCVSMSAGEHGTTDPEAWPPSRLAAIRRREAADAMAVLGVTEHHVLDLPDGRFADETATGLAAVGRLLDDVVPDTVVTFGPDGATFHPDHLAVHGWVTAAWRQRDRAPRLLYATARARHLRRIRPLLESWGVYMGDRRPVGLPDELVAVHLRLRGADLTRKLDALRAMPSQTGAVLATTDPVVFAAMAADESFVDATRIDIGAGLATPATAC